MISINHQNNTILLSEWAIKFLTGVGVNLYDWTDDSKKIEIKEIWDGLKG